MDSTCEKTLEDLFQKEVKITIDNKKVKNGRVIIYKQKNFIIELYIKISDGKLKKLEIPIPFKIEKIGKKIYFNYQLKTLANNDKECYTRLVKYTNRIKNKFLNRIMLIEEV